MNKENSIIMIQFRLNKTSKNDTPTYLQVLRTYPKWVKRSKEIESES